MNIFRNEEEMEKEFHVSIYIIIYKFALGLAESLMGVAVAFFGRRLYLLYETRLIREISEDPHDLLARVSESFVPHLLTHNTYIVIYLMLLGIAKMLGAIGLIYKQNWGVDLLVGLTILMVPFQIVNLIVHPGWFDLIYFTVGLLIALYLIKFRPRTWISRVAKLN